MDWNGVAVLAQEVAGQIKASKWQPTLIVALSRGGFVPATMLAHQLGVRDLLGIDVQKDEKGRRSIGRFSRLNDLTGQQVLIVDDGIIMGSLFAMTTKAVSASGGTARTCALISEGKGPAPDYLAETQARIPDFPWE